MDSFAMVRDIHGGPLMVRGVDRLIGRITRAVATPRGSFWADPAYGSEAVPGVSFERSVPMQILSAVMTEVARYAISSPQSPGDRVGQVRVVTTSLASDARTVLVDIMLYDGAGIATPAQIAF
jgi:phage baseplate assembly protein W